MAETMTVKKAAYATLGLPSHIIKKLREGVSSVAESTDEAKDRLMLQVQEIVDEWKEEGERITTSVVDKVKGKTDDAKDTARERIAVAEDVTRGVAATVRTPGVPVEQIDGVGPTYAEELATAGVATTRALLERCDSDEATERLADQTGISAGTIAKWVADANLTQINGVGVEHMNLLSAMGIGSISHLAEQDAAELRKMAKSLDDSAVGPIPSEETFGRWIEHAKAI